MGHYDEYEEQDRRQSCDGITLKHTNGKEEGARFCFLYELAHNDQVLDYGLGNLIDDLMSNYEAIKKDSKEKRIDLLYSKVQNVIKILVASNKRQVISDLIKLRHQAVDSGKYSVNSYKIKIDLSLLLDALARHYIKYSFGDERDEESGYLHKSHMLANLLIIRYQLRTYEIDN